jgi:hypothetical protein
MALDSRDLTLAQLDALFAKLAPMAHYVRKLEYRMHHECFPVDDELFKLVEQTRAAMLSLSIHTHYAACDKVMRKPK